ncbi:MAG: HAMP domain-containing histidine kinase [Gammaproteobacteria bacterium]|nr:HAMP domain-containing histidine kinase [Gammaproteobacteria bacterium]
MFKRMLPALITLALGTAALAWGLIVLQRIFIQERDTAYTTVQARRTALEQYALEALALELNRKLQTRESAIHVAMDDPLASAKGLYLRLGGQQYLPRPLEVRPGDGEEAIELYRRLRDSRRASLDPEPGSPWADRLALREQFLTALNQKRNEEVENLFRRILAHRAQYLIAATHDLPYMLALLDDFVAAGQPDPRLLSLLLRDGITDRHGRKTEGLQRRLLRRGDKFTAREVDFLAARIKALARIGSVRMDDFEARIREQPGPTLAVPAQLPAPLILFSGRWYLEPHPGREIQGVEIDLPQILKTLALEMHRRGLIQQGDKVAVAPLGERVSLDVELGLTIQSPSWAKSMRDIASHFRLKSILIVVCGILAVGIGALAIFVQYRKQRHLELKADFIATITHELRTPLASVRLLAETLQRRLGGDHRAKDYPDRIIRDIEGLGFLVENILSFNRIHKGKLRPRRQLVNIVEILDYVREEVEHHIAKAIHWSVELPASMEVQADPTLLQLLFMNLARNACQYNDREPVTITVEIKGEERTRLHFADNGRGIPPKEWKPVFSEFHRGGDTSVRGAGLGLAICAKIMAIHGGRMWIGGSGPQGTDFVLEFPARPG